MILLANAEVFDPAPRGRRHLLVAGERIAWMGAQRPDLPASLGVEVVDLEGRRLVPGFVDAHTHLTGGGGETGPASRVPPLPLSQLTTAGVTTAVGLLGTDDTVRTTGELLAAARALNAEGITALCWTGGYHVPPATLTGSVRGDLCHLDLVIGVGELAISDHRSSQPTLDELLRVAADAHVGGIMTGKAGVLHLHVGDGPRGLGLVREALDASELPARVFHPTHVNRRAALLDEAFALAGVGCTIDVTAFPADDEGDGVLAADAIARYLESGLPPERLTVSSDGGGCLPRFGADGLPEGMGVATPSSLSACLQALLARGVPPGQALPPFTANPAAHLRLARKGRVAAGCDADLVVLDEDHGVADVMARGAWFVRGGLPVRLGAFEPRA
jgi:beta-aspartyl-dipeptidase (metallo-type)